MPSPIQVSIIIPVYNAGASIDACLASISSQDCGDIEIIVVDDGSTDDSAAGLKVWAGRDPRLVILSHPQNANRGVAATRNLGLQHAHGDYIWFVDADDRVKPGAVANLLSMAKNHGSDIVAFNGDEFVLGVAVGRIYRQPKPLTVVTGEAWVKLSCEQKEFPHLVWLRFYRRAFLEACGLQFKEGIVHEDIGWITEGDLRAPRFIYIDRALYEYQRHEQSITGSSSETSLLRRAEGLLEVVAQLRDINLRVPMSVATRNLLRAELVGQGLQVDRLRQHIHTPERRQRIDQQIKAANLWRSLWRDATRLTRKRQLLQVMWREFIRR